MQQHVEQRELDLAHRHHAALEILRRQHLVEQGARQRGAGVDVGGHALQHIPFPAVVFHELRRQFDGIPLDAVDAGNAQFLAARQQVVQAVAGFVEQRDHFVVGEGGGLVADRAGEIAVEVGDRLLDAADGAATGAGLVHPGAAALGFAGVEVEVELADQIASRGFQPVETDVFVPDRCVVRL